MTTLTALSRPRLLLAAGPMRRGLLIGFSVTLAVGLMLLLGASFGVGLSHADRVMPGVSIAGVPLGGLDRGAAIAQLEAGLPSPSSGILALRVDGEAFEVPFADLGRAYDLDATVDAAMGVARSGNPLTDAVSRLRALAKPTTLASATLLQDSVAIEGLVTSVVRRLDRQPVDGGVTPNAAGGFAATAAAAGRTVQADALRQSLASLLAAPTGGDAELEVAVTREEPAVGTADAVAAAAAARSISVTPLSLTGGGKKLALDEETLARLITFGPRDDGSWGEVIDSATLQKLLKPIAGQLSHEAHNASFIFGATGLSGVVRAEPGRRLKLAPSVAAVMAALDRRAAGLLTPSAALSVGVAQPLLTTREARAAAPEMRQLSTWTTYFVPGDGNFWGANITIPARDLDGTVVAPGEWFEFWQGIGPVTLERGYGYGGVIIGGRSVHNGAIAGGICSTSTTLFNAAMRAGLEIGERTNHSYYIDRYPTGLDATVLKTDSYETDMTFRNDTANPVVIRSYTGAGFVRFDIWGVPDRRSVSLSAPRTSNYGTAHETTVFNPDLAPGTALRVEYMHNGFDAVVTRWVRDRDGKLIHEDTWFSHYNTVNGVTEVGPRKSAD